MLISADAGRQNLRNISVGQGWETPVHTARCCNTPFGSDVSESIYKCKYALFVIVEYLLVIPGLNTAEGHGRPVCKTECENSRGNIRSERHDSGIPSDLNTRLNQLLNKCCAIMICRAENIEVFLLIILDNHLGCLRIGARADDCCKTWCAAVNKLNASFPENDIVCRSHPYFSGFNIRIFLGQIKIRFPENAQSFDNLISENSGHAGIQKRPEIGQMVYAFDMRRKKTAGKFQRFLYILKSFNLHSGKRVNNRKVITGVREFYLRTCIKSFKSFLVFTFSS